MKKKIFCCVIFMSLIFSSCPYVFAEDNVEEVNVNVDENIIEQQEENIEQVSEEEVVVEEEVEETTPEREEQTPNEDGSVAVHYMNIISSLNREDGVPVPYEKVIILSATQTKNQAHKGTYSYFGGADYSFGYMGVQYTFLNAVVETEKDKNSPVFEEEAPKDTTITKVKNSSGNITYTYKNGETEDVESRSDIYLSPVYKQEQNWKLNYNYIDNISTGSGHWSNLDAITEYKHTFSNPEEKSPSIIDGNYQFVYWENEETGVQYVSGDQFIYSSPELRSLEKTINVYAYWQPAVKVNLYNGSELVQTISSFDQINSSDFIVLADTDKQEFIGWSDENNELADIYYAPSITKEAGYLVIDLYANFKDKPVDEPKEEPTKPTPKVNPTVPTPQVEEDVIVNTDPPTTIKSDPVPKSTSSDYWALINLILVVIAVLIALISVRKKKEKSDEEYSDEDKRDIRNLFKYKLFSLFVSLGGIIVFILTEDITLPMGYIDNWTLIMVLFPVVEIFNTYFINKIANYKNNKEY